MPKLTTIDLRQIETVPKDLQPGVLYVSARFEVAVHLCACGCGRKVTSSLKPTEWKFSVKNGRPSLSPSIGNWQHSCQSHYWITDGKILWAKPWTKEQIAAGRLGEELRREKYYAERDQRRAGWFRRALRWIQSFYRRP